MAAKILIAEDDADIQEILKLYLENAGFKMQVSTQNEPAIFVTEKAVGGFSMLEAL